MSELIQLDNLSLDTLTELAKESFADCQDALQVYLNNEQKLKRFGDILRACRAKVPHGQWQQWVLDTFAGHLSLRVVQLWIAEAKEPEKRQKRLEHDREQKQKAKGPKAQDLALLPEQPPSAPPAPAQPAKLERPAWLADPDELERPEADDLPPLPRTNTNHTPDNRRTPDAREMDLASVVTVEESFRHGVWYEWSEPRQRMIPLDDYAICCRAEEISPPPAELATVLARHNADDILRVMLETRDGRRESPKEMLRLLKKTVEELQEPSRSSKRFTKPTAAEVAAYATEIGAAIDAEQFCDFYESKDWMIGKNRMKDWRAAVRTWKRGQAAKPGTIENGKVRGANWEDDGTGWEDLRDG